MRTKKGFTLIELLVAIAIFTILVAIGVGGFAHALRTQREIASLIATQSNVSVALEQMAREIRTGYVFCNTPGDNGQLPAICQSDSLGVDAAGLASGCQQAPGGNVNDPVWTCNDVLDFYNANSQEVDYELVGGVLQRSQNGPGGPFTPITASNVNVSRLVFTIFGNTEGDNWPPRITISLSVEPSSTDPALESDVLNLQTTVSARQIDCTTGPSPVC